MTCTATDVKGLRGHLGALGTGKYQRIDEAGRSRGGRRHQRSDGAGRGRGGVIDALLAGAVVAGAANFANLLDLRPGRAGKAFLLERTPPPRLASAGTGTVAAPVGAVAMLADDLMRVAMLGDTGANALGAAWGIGWSPHSDEGRSPPFVALPDSPWQANGSASPKSSGGRRRCASRPAGAQDPMSGE